MIKCNIFQIFVLKDLQSKNYQEKLNHNNSFYYIKLLSNISNLEIIDGNNNGDRLGKNTENLAQTVRNFHHCNPPGHHCPLVERMISFCHQLLTSLESGGQPTFCHLTLGQFLYIKGWNRKGGQSCGGLNFPGRGAGAGLNSLRKYILTCI